MTAQTHSITYWATRVFFPTETDLVPIYESVTSFIRVDLNDDCLTNHSLNSLMNQLIHECPLFYNLGRTELRSPSRKFRPLFYYSVATKVFT